jgi:hypothetical protein
LLILVTSSELAFPCSSNQRPDPRSGVRSRLMLRDKGAGHRCTRVTLFIALMGAATPGSPFPGPDATLRWSGGRPRKVDRKRLPARRLRPDRCSGAPHEPRRRHHRTRQTPGDKFSGSKKKHPHHLRPRPARLGRAHEPGSLHAAIARERCRACGDVQH